MQKSEVDDYFRRLDIILFRQTKIYVYMYREILRNDIT